VTVWKEGASPEGLGDVIAGLGRRTDRHVSATEPRVRGIAGFVGTLTKG
jgi:hypothetical protein